MRQGQWQPRPFPSLSEDSADRLWAVRQGPLWPTDMRVHGSEPRRRWFGRQIRTATCEADGHFGIKGAGVSWLYSIRISDPFAWRSREIRPCTSREVCRSASRRGSVRTRLESKKQIEELKQGRETGFPISSQLSAPTSRFGRSPMTWRSVILPKALRIFEAHSGSSLFEKAAAARFDIHSPEFQQGIKNADRKSGRGGQGGNR